MSVHSLLRVAERFALHPSQSERALAHTCVHAQMHTHIHTDTQAQAHTQSHACKHAHSIAHTQSHRAYRLHQAISLTQPHHGMPPLHTQEPLPFVPAPLKSTLAKSAPKLEVGSLASGMPAVAVDTACGCLCAHHLRVLCISVHRCTNAHRCTQT